MLFPCANSNFARSLMVFYHFLSDNERGYLVRGKLLLIMGNMNMVAGNTEKAKKFYKAAIKKRVKSALAYLNYSVLLMQEGENAEAKIHLETGLSLKRKKPLTDKNLLSSLGTCQWLLGNLDESVKTFETLKRKYTYINAGVLTTLGFVYLLKGELDKAESTTLEALRDDSSYASAWDNMGQINFARGLFDDARENFLKAVEYKELPDSLYYLGVLSEVEKNAEEARGWYERALNANISGLNTITRAQIEGKLAKLAKNEEREDELE